MFSPKSRQKSAEERMREMEERTKLNRGSYSTLAEDTGSNIPFMLPGQRMRNPLGDTAQAQLARVQFPQGEDYSMMDEEPMPDMGMPQFQDQQFSAQDFLNYFNQQFNAPDMSQGIASTPDGGILYQDGTIHYQDGTVRYGGTGQPGAYPVASMPDGSIRYSDGSMRSFGQPGMEGLQTGLFGQVLPTTQPYGNYNPGMGYKGNVHGGVDLRTRDLAGEQRNFRLPIDAQVVQVMTEDMGSPYGNSVLLKLPSGEMLRFSHLSQIAQLQPGQTIAAGQVFGSPGSTGKSTAEHLDLEYYDPSGTRNDPSQFKGFTKEIQQPQGQVLGATQEQPQQTQPQPQVTPQQNQGSILSPVGQLADKVTNQFDKGNPNVIQPNQNNNFKTTTANVIDYANPTGQFGAGVSETLRGKPEMARAEQLNTIRSFAPGSAKRSGEQGTDPFKQLVGDALDTLGTRMKEMGLPVLDKNISERIAGGMTRFTPQAYAAEVNTEVPDAGEGINQLKGQRGQVLGMQSARPDMSEISSPKVVGDVSGGDYVSGTFSPNKNSITSDTAQLQSKMQGYDARDPFFRQGLNEKFASDIDPEKAQSGALTLDLFKPSFYQTPNKINTAFSGTSLFGSAQNKYSEAVEALKQQYRSMFGNASYDQGDLERILSSIPQGADLSQLNLGTPAKANYDFSSSGSSGGSSGSGWDAPTSNASASLAPRSESQLASLAKLSSNLPIKSQDTAAARGFQLNTSPTSASSATINKQAQQPQTSIFSRIGSAISSLFRRS